MNNVATRWFCKLLFVDNCWSMHSIIVSVLLVDGSHSVITSWWFMYHVVVVASLWLIQVYIVVVSELLARVRCCCSTSLYMASYKPQNH